MTTVALFLAAAAVLYLARDAFFILVLSILFAYLLEPAITFAQQHSRLARGNRVGAIAHVYVVGLLALVVVGYAFGGQIVGQIKALDKTLPQILQGLSDRSVATDFVARHGLSAAQQQKIHEWLARNHDSITGAFERGAASAAYLTEKIAWLFAVPILAIFILQGRSQLAAATLHVLGRGRDDARVKRILDQVDAMLARYVRAQLILSALSFIFYGLVLFFLGFPYAIALALLGAILEFLPAVGWIIFGAATLMIGFLTHAHWIWFGLLLAIWRMVQGYVNSPRIMGNTLQLQPLTVLFVLMVGDQVGGIAGLFLSVPVAAVLRIVWLGCFPADSAQDVRSQYAGS
jgi:predicted PurR-regulated permease PerM